MKKIMFVAVAAVAMTTFGATTETKYIDWSKFDTNGVCTVSVIKKTVEGTNTTITVEREVGKFKKGEVTQIDNGYVLDATARDYGKVPQLATTQYNGAMMLLNNALGQKAVTSSRPWFGKEKKEAWDKLQQAVQDGLNEETIKNFDEEAKFKARLMKDVLILQ